MKHHHFNYSFIFLLGLSLVFLYFSFDDSAFNFNKAKITNFQECIEAGNAVMESYPRQCRTEDGQHFVEDIAAADLLFRNNSNETTIKNQGKHLEGHTPRGFKGEGAGLFVGDNLNESFPEGDGVQAFITFDLAGLPSFVEEATITSPYAHTTGNPYEDLGNLMVHEVRYQAFSPALWDLETETFSCIFATDSQGPFECDVTEVVNRALAERYPYAQFVLQFEKVSDSDGSPDLASFYITDSNRNAPGIFKLNVTRGNEILTNVVPENISFQASDGYKLSGTFYELEGGASGSPIVILSHQFNSNRTEYDSFLPVLLENNFSVFTYDTRGMGESVNGESDIRDFVKDVEGVITHLKTKAGVDMNNIFIIGASVGANVAFVSSGSIPEIIAAVSLSPSNTGGRGILMGQNINDFKPTNIFIASDEKEQDSASVIFNLSNEPRVQKVYEGAGHGISILSDDNAKIDIIQFLLENIRE